MELELGIKIESFESNIETSTKATKESKNEIKLDSLKLNI